MALDICAFGVDFCAAWCVAFVLVGALYFFAVAGFFVVAGLLVLAGLFALFCLVFTALVDFGFVGFIVTLFGFGDF